MVAIFIRKIKNLIAERANLIYAEGIKTKFHVQFEKELADMLHFGNNASSSGAKTASDRLKERKMIKLFICAVAGDIISACSKPQSPLDTPINSVL